MLWLTSKFSKLVEENIAKDLRKSKTLAFMRILLNPLDQIRKNALYQAQHDGRKIYLEKVLNEFYSMPGYDPQAHEMTKIIYIEDIDQDEPPYIFQPDEDEVIYVFQEGESDPETIYLDNDASDDDGFGFVIFVPDDLIFEEATLRAVVDTYRFIGKRYLIQTYIHLS